MNRRTAIRNVVIISAGAGLLPSCMQEDKSTLQLKNIPLTGKQEQMMATLAETIIPKTNDFVGAKDLKAHEFVLTMVDDCSSPGDQQKFITGMKQFEEHCRKLWNNPFVKCSPAQQTELLRLMQTRKDVPAEAVAFYQTVKRYTVQSFVSSKEFMTTVRKYKMVPGNKFSGCVPVT